MDGKKDFFVRDDEEKKISPLASLGRNDNEGVRLGRNDNEGRLRLGRNDNEGRLRLGRNDNEGVRSVEMTEDGLHSARGDIRERVHERVVAVHERAMTMHELVRQKEEDFSARLRSVEMTMRDGVRSARNDIRDGVRSARNDIRDGVRLGRNDIRERVHERGVAVRRSMALRVPACLIVAAMLASLMGAIPALAVGENLAGGFTQEYNLTTTTDPVTVSSAGTYHFSGTGTQPVTVAENVTATLVLDGVSIASATSPLQLGAGSKVTLLLKDGTTNTLKCTATTVTAGSPTAGILVPSTASLTVDKAEGQEGTGKLSVTAGYGGAGIGSSAATGTQADSVNRNTYPATPTADWGGKSTGAYYVPGGRTNGGAPGYNGANADAAGTITINAGVIESTGGQGGAGIGGGMGAQGTQGYNGPNGSTYYHPTFTPVHEFGDGGGGGGAGGMGGRGGAGGTVTITGGNVTATAGTYNYAWTDANNGSAQSVDRTAAGIGGGAGGLGGDNGVGGSPAGGGVWDRYGGAGGYGEAGYTNYGGDGGSVTITGGVVKAQGSVGVGSPKLQPGIYGAHKSRDYNRNASKQGHGGGGGQGGQATQPTDTVNQGTVNITGSTNNVEFIDSAGNTSTGNTPHDKNGENLYKAVLTVKNAQTGGLVEGAAVVLTVNKGTDSMQYDYTTVTRADGTAILWLPVGEYNISGSVVTKAGIGHITPDGNATLTVGTGNDASAEVKIGSYVGFTASPASGKVYDGTVDLTVDVSDVDGEVSAIRWFREKVNNNTTVYANQEDKATGAKTFDSGYEAASTDNKGDIELSSLKDGAFTKQVDQNGVYWVEVSYGSGDSAKLIKSVTVSNIYHTIDIQAKSYVLQDGEKSGETDYGPLKNANGTTYTKQYGFAWDLDGYQKDNLASGTLLEKPGDGFDTVDLWAQTESMTFYSAALETGKTFDYDEASKAYKPVTLTLDKDFLTNNQDCDTVDGKKDYTKYSIVYSPRDGALRVVKITGVERTKGKSANTETLYTHERAYTDKVDHDMIAAFEWTGYKVVDVLVNGQETEFSKDADGNLTDTVALNDIHGKTSGTKIKTVQFVYEYNMTDVKVQGFYKGTTKTVGGFDTYTVKAEIGKPFTVSQPEINGYVLESTSPENATITPTGKADDDVVTFYYTKQTGNVTYKAVSVDEDTAGANGAARTTTLWTGSGTVAKGEKPSDVTPSAGVDYYTRDDSVNTTYTDAAGGTVPGGVYDGVNDITVTYTYKHKTRDVKVIKRNLDTGDEIGTQTITGLPVGVSHTFSTGEVSAVDGYTASDTNLGSMFVADRDGQEVTFWYRSNDRFTNVAVTLTYGDTTLRSYTINAVKGVETPVNAPEMTGYKLKSTSNGLTSIMPTGDADHDKINFEYELDDPKTVTVELVDASENKKLSAPTGYQTTVTLKKGDTVTLLAAVVNGYSVEGDHAKTLTYADVKNGETVKFSYQPVSDAEFVTHTITFKAGNEDLHSYSVKVKRGLGVGESVVYDASTAPRVPGYRLKEVKCEPATPTNVADAQIQYIYEEDSAKITVESWLTATSTDEGGTKLDGDVELTGYRLGQTDVVVNAPSRTDYALSGDLQQTIKELSGANTTVKFLYHDPANVTFTLRDIATGKVIEVVNGVQGETFTAGEGELDLKDSYYTYKTDSRASEPFQEGGSGKVENINLDVEKKINYDVYYEKATREVEYVAIDSTKLEQSNFKTASAEDIAAATIKDLHASKPEAARVGEEYSVSAQSFDGWSLDDDLTKFYDVTDESGALKVYFWYKPKSSGTVSVEYWTGNSTNNGESLGTYTLNAVLGEKLTVKALDTILEGKYTIRAGQGTQTVTVGSTNVVKFYYDPNFVTVRTTVAINSAVANEQTTNEVVKGGTLVLRPPYRAGYTLVGIEGVDGGSATTLPASYKSGKITLTNLESDQDLTYNYKKTKAAEYQTEVSVKATYHNWTLGTDGVAKVERNGSERVTVPTYEGYIPTRFTLVSGTSTDTATWQDVTDEMKTNGVPVSLDADAATLTIEYQREGDATVLPGKDNKIGSEDDVIITPADADKKPVVNAGPTPEKGSVTIPEGTSATITRPSGEQVVVPSGTTINPDGTIVLPDGAGEIKPGEVASETVPDGWVALTYKANGGTGTDITQMSKANALTAIANPFELPTNFRFAGWNERAKGTADITYQAGSTIIVPNGTKNLTMYAKWIEATYAHQANVTYKPNGATGADRTLVVGDQEDTTFKVVIEPSGFQVTGWNFSAWNTSADGNGTRYLPTDVTEVSEGDALALYAQWYKTNDDGSMTLPGKDGNPTTIGDNVTVVPENGGRAPSFDTANGVAVVPEDSSATVVRGSDAEEEIVVPGASTIAPDGTITLPGGSTIAPDAELPAALSAEWLMVTFEAGQGSGRAVHRLVKRGDSFEVPGQGSFVAPIGMCFTQYADSKGTAYTTGGDAVTPTGHLTLIAQWRDVDTSRPLRNADGSITLPGKDGTTLEVKDNALVTPGKDEEDVDNSVINDDASVTLPDGGTVKYPSEPEGNGTTVTVPAGTTVASDGSLTVPEDSEASVEPSGAKVPGGSTIAPDGTITYKYTVRYVDEEGKELKAATSLMVVDSEETTVDALVIKNKTPEPNEMSFTGGQTVGTDENPFTIEFVYWDTYTATVIYYGNGADGEPVREQVTGVSTLIVHELTANTFTFGDWTFMGWNTEKSGNGTFYPDEATATLRPGTTLELYAVWYKQNSNDIMLCNAPGMEIVGNVAPDGNGGISVADGGQIVTASKTITVTGNATVKPDGTITLPKGVSAKIAPDDAQITGPAIISPASTVTTENKNNGGNGGSNGNSGNGTNANNTANSNRNSGNGSNGNSGNGSDGSNADGDNAGSDSDAADSDENSATGATHSGQRGASVAEGGLAGTLATSAGRVFFTVVLPILLLLVLVAIVAWCVVRRRRVKQQ